MVVNNSEFIKNKMRINDLFEKLRNKLNSFEVINLAGKTIGRIKDFTLDKSRRLYMVIPQTDGVSDSAVYLLSSKYIQKVDTSNRAVFVNISHTELKELPLYQPSTSTERSAQSPTSTLPEEHISSSEKVLSLDENQFAKIQSSTTQNFKEVDREGFVESDESPEVVEEQIVPLLEERLIVNRSKRKLGEIVVRKEIGTRIIEVPVQSEKLIIEKVGSESKQPVGVEQLPLDQVSQDRITEGLDYSSIQSGTPASITHYGETQPSRRQSFTSENLEEVDNNSFLESDDVIAVAEEEIVRLLEERLIVNRSKWKVGEVIVRKEVETQIVQVPIHREKLIVEQVSPQTRQIAEIDLAPEGVTGIELTQTPASDTVERSVSSADSPNTVVGEFFSPKAASHLLEAIALQKYHGCAKVRVELVVDNPELQEAYQTMFDRCSKH